MKHIKTTRKTGNGVRKVDTATEADCLKFMGSNGGFTANYAMRFAELHNVSPDDIIVVIDRHGVYVVRGSINEDGNIDVDTDNAIGELDDFAVCVHEFVKAKG